MKYKCPCCGCYTYPVPPERDVRSPRPDESKEFDE